MLYSLALFDYIFISVARKILYPCYSVIWNRPKCQTSRYCSLGEVLVLSSQLDVFKKLFQLEHAYHILYRFLSLYLNSLSLLLWVFNVDNRVCEGWGMATELQAKSGWHSTLQMREQLFFLLKNRMSLRTATSFLLVIKLQANEKCHTRRVHHYELILYFLCASEICFP